MTALSRADLAALLLRTSLGVMFIAHALLKYFVFRFTAPNGGWEYPAFLRSSR